MKIIRSKTLGGTQARKTRLRLPRAILVSPFQGHEADLLRGATAKETQKQFQKPWASALRLIKSAATR